MYMQRVSILILMDIALIPLPEESEVEDEDVFQSLF